LTVAFLCARREDEKPPRAALIVIGLLLTSALLARVHTFEWVAMAGFAVAAVLGVYMFWKIIRTPGEL